MKKENTKMATKNKFKDQEQEILENEFSKNDQFLIMACIKIPDFIDVHKCNALLGTQNSAALKKEIQSKIITNCRCEPLRRKRLMLYKKWFPITDEEIDSYLKIDFPNVSQNDFDFKITYFNEEPYLIVMTSDNEFLQSNSIKSKEIKDMWCIIFSRDLCFPVIRYLFEYIFKMNDLQLKTMNMLTELSSYVCELEIEYNDSKINNIINIYGLEKQKKQEKRGEIKVNKTNNCNRPLVDESFFKALSSFNPKDIKNKYCYITKDYVFTETEPESFYDDRMRKVVNRDIWEKDCYKYTLEQQKEHKSALEKQGLFDAYISLESFLENHRYIKMLYCDKSQDWKAPYQIIERDLAYGYKLSGFKILDDCVIWEITTYERAIKENDYICGLDVCYLMFKDSATTEAISHSDYKLLCDQNKLSDNSFNVCSSQYIAISNIPQEFF